MTKKATIEMKSDAAKNARPKQPAGLGVGRRHLLKLAGVAAASGALACQSGAHAARGAASAQDTGGWDKSVTPTVA